MTLAHSCTDCLLTPNRRATPAWLTPSSKRRAPCNRRSSICSKSLLLLILFRSKMYANMSVCYAEISKASKDRYFHPIQDQSKSKGSCEFAKHHGDR
jgi:hypothetical protein